jgi:excisionase family DNA binding protein
MINSATTQDDDLNYVTIREAARYLGVGRKIIYQLIEFDRIRATRKRRVILVDKHSLEDFRRSGGLA